MARTYKRDRYGKFSATAGGRATRPDGTKGATQVIRGPKAPIASRVAVPAGRKPTAKPKAPKPPTPKFVGKLKEQNFKEVAKEGSYTYGYTRADTGKLYYVGVSRTASRPFGKHDVMVPSNRRQVVVLKKGLTREQAAAQEKRYVARYGRRDKGTGRLHNRTAGGAGVHDMAPDALARRSLAVKNALRTPEVRAKLSEANKAASSTPKARAKKSAAARLASSTPEARAKKSAAARLAASTPEAFAKRSAATKATWDNPEKRARRTAALKAKARSPEARAEQSARSKANRTAEGSARTLAGSKASWDNPEKRAKRTAAIKASWGDAEKRAQRMAAIKAAGVARAAKGAAELGIPLDAYLAMPEHTRSRARKKKREAAGG